MTLVSVFPPYGPESSDWRSFLYSPAVALFSVYFSSPPPTIVLRGAFFLVELQDGCWESIREENSIFHRPLSRMLLVFASRMFLFLFVSPIDLSCLSHDIFAQTSFGAPSRCCCAGRRPRAFSQMTAWHVFS